MLELAKQLQNEGYYILRLCVDLNEFIRSGRARKTYLIETDWFLDYITKSLKAIRTFVRKIVEKPPEIELIKSRLRDLGETRKVLFVLYTLAKEAIDADSLAIPFSLANYLNHVAKGLRKKNKCQLVVLSGSNLMYYKFNLRPFRDLTQYLANRIEDYPCLSKDTGILMFPYCASREVLVNCNLFHEMGHYFYENAELEQHFKDELEKKLRAFFIEKQVVTKIEAPLLAWKALQNYVLSLMLRWAEEIFADIFAIRVVGFAFHLAYEEIEQIIPTTVKKIFSETHPADDFRFKIHAKWLNKDGWGNILKENLPSTFKELERCEKLDIKSFVVGCSPPVQLADIQEMLHKWMLYEFEQTVEKIEAGVSNVLDGNFQNPVNDFVQNHDFVTDYLEHGVVPSTYYDNNGQEHHPNPTTMLNSGFLFYLEKMDELLKKVVSTEPEIEKRMKYEKRLNEWLGKAINDWQILHEENIL